VIIEATGAAADMTNTELLEASKRVAWIESQTAQRPGEPSSFHERRVDSMLCELFIDRGGPPGSFGDKVLAAVPSDHPMAVKVRRFRERIHPSHPRNNHKTDPQIAQPEEQPHVAEGFRW